MTSKQLSILALAGGALLAVVLLSGRKEHPATMKIAAAFSKHLKRTLTKVQRTSIDDIVRAFEQYGDGDTRKLVYIIALAYHESLLTPIKEIKAKEGTRIWEYQKAYWPSGYYGRGFVQLTWKGNYQKMGKRLNLKLAENPDLALKSTVAAQIIVVGMMEGLFTVYKGTNTRNKLPDYFTATTADYYNARTTVGAVMVADLDTAKRIEGFALGILANLTAV